ncbi:MAG: amidohydrolase, partial [Gammaproteobacteria bacterium]|nr:amidohydrolase [Gammaproteobacteria bacterium]
MSKPFSRREFLAILGSVSMAGCAEQTSSERYSQQDREQLLRQQRTEAIQTGRSRFGVQRYRGYRGLAELPWFELDKNGNLFCSDDSVPRAIDMHCHLGMSVLFEPELDLHSEKNRTRHLLDCDENNPGCELDLDKYVNANFTEENLKTLKSTIRSQGLWGNDFSESQTLPNLLTEMDAMRVDKAAILPIKLGLWFGDNQTEHWREATANPKYNSRLLSAFSVHPRDDDKVKQLKEHAASDYSNAIK